MICWLLTREREREKRGERFNSRIPTCNNMNGHNKVSKRERERECERERERVCVCEREREREIDNILLTYHI
jgi:hypothetical protein